MLSRASRRRIDAAAGTRGPSTTWRCRRLAATFKGRLDADTRAAVPGLTLTGSMTGARRRRPAQRTGSAGGITGRLSGNLSLAAQGSGRGAADPQRAGTITATIAERHAAAPRHGAPIVLAFGKPSGAPAEGAGTAFTTLGGTFALASSTLRSDNLSLRSPDVDSDGHGTLRIESGAVDARADVSLSPELTAQAGTDLRRYAQQDGRVIVPATVGGTLAVRPS